MCKNQRPLGQVPGGGEVVAEEGVVVVACEDGRVGVQEEGGDIYIVAFGRMMLPPFLMNIDFTLGVVLTMRCWQKESVEPSVLQTLCGNKQLEPTKLHLREALQLI